MNTVNEQKPLTKGQIARHWGVSAPYLAKLSRPVTEGGKAMPDFFMLADADSWRAVHAPPRAGGKNAKKHTPPPENEKARAPAPCNDAGSSESSAVPVASPGDPAADGARRALIDIKQFTQRHADFDGAMISDAEIALQVAYGLFMLACERGEPGAISAANKNWHEVGKVSADIRARYIEIREKTRALLSLDEVLDVVGTELQSLRRQLLNLGARLGSTANPADPALAERIINAAIDGIFRDMDLVESRARTELAPQSPSAHPLAAQPPPPAIPPSPAASPETAAPCDLATAPANIASAAPATP